MKATLSTLKEDIWGICSVVNVGPTDPRFLRYANQALQRIHTSGENFWGVAGRFQMCVHNQCVTWPRQVAAIESLWTCGGAPIAIRNQWFEYLESGPGLQGVCRNNNTNCSQSGPWWNWGGCGIQSYDRGQACTFRDISGINKRVRVYADIAETAGTKIFLQGYDENGIWIRTQVDGEWVDGEYVTISTTPTNSTKLFSSLVAVQKPITNGNVRLYEYNVDTTTQRAIAVYEPSETLPTYRRSYIPGIKCNTCCDTDSEEEDACRRTKVTAIARMEFVPLVHDTDWVIPANPTAIKDMMQSVRLADNSNAQEALYYEQKCFANLRTELRSYLGHGIVQPVKMQPANIAGPAVHNLI